ncbi:MAG: thioesterase domain-containing protein [Pseudomonadota bacterium]|nr:thioesterase domain-containing protein [Pseudomonadota bacterium]
MHPNDPLQRLYAHYQSMPPVAVMELGIAGFDGARLQLHAPLSRHVNDKGCAFGGSLASMMTLASWGLMWLELEAASLEADIFVADSQIRYLAPLYDDLRVESELAAGADWPTFFATLRQRGRARASIVAKAGLPGGGVACDFTARYVAIARGDRAAAPRPLG